MWIVTRVDAQDGHRDEMPFEEARQTLEPSYYKPGTVEELCTDKTPFTLRSLFAFYEFSLKEPG